MRLIAPIIRRLLLTTACLGGMVAATSCTAPSITRGGFDSPAPAARTHAIKVTVETAESNGVLQRSDLKQMVSLLLADDSMVRFMAINGLIQLTGQDLGYRFFDPPEVRFRSVLEWREYALTSNGSDRIRVVPPAPNGSPSPEEEAKG